ncbi:MAG: STAS domain-containing protein [Opitutales bacterium]|jgi:anti-anti-sigma factor
MKAEKEDLTLILHMEEDLTSTTVEHLQKLYLAALDKLVPVACVTANITQVEMIDSQGLNFLVGLHRDACANDRMFRICGASPMNQRLFDMVNLGEHLRMD